MVPNVAFIVDADDKEYDSSDNHYLCKILMHLVYTAQTSRCTNMADIWKVEKTN